MLQGVTKKDKRENDNEVTRPMKAKKKHIEQNVIQRRRRNSTSRKVRTDNTVAALRERERERWLQQKNNVSILKMKKKEKEWIRGHVLWAIKKRHTKQNVV
jgi:hypothetical protein